MNLTHRLVRPSPNIVAETIDGETVILNMETGVYYSLSGCGAEVWTRLEQGLTLQETIDDLEKCFDAARAELEVSVNELVRQLEQELLLARVAASDGLDDKSRPGNGRARANGTRRPFAAPMLQKFVDMQDLLLLDPIHEVSEAGWPHKPS